MPELASPFWKGLGTKEFSLAGCVVSQFNLTMEKPQRVQADCPDPEGGVSDPFHML